HRTSWFLSSPTKGCTSHPSRRCTECSADTACVRRSGLRRGHTWLAHPQCTRRLRRTRCGAGTSPGCRRRCAERTCISTSSWTSGAVALSAGASRNVSRQRRRLPFADLASANRWVARFVDWYNGTHRHSAIRYVTPDQRHNGREGAVLASRNELYQRARRASPERWSGSTRNWLPVGLVVLNPERAPHRAAA